MFENPSYIESDYMTTLAGEQIAEGKPQGSVLHPTTEAKMRREAQANGQTFDPTQHYRDQYEKMPDGVTPLPYSMRAGVAPYTLNYEYANTPESMAYTPYGGIFDATFSSRATPFKTALATSSLIVLGAVVGEVVFGDTIANVIGKKTDKFYKKQKLPVGMGALIGAITANAIRMGIAGQISSGWKPALTSFAGGMLPVTLPIGLTLLDQPNIKNNKTQIALGVGGLAMLSVPFIIKLSNK